MLKDILRSSGSQARVVAKIEKGEALDRLDEIVLFDILSPDAIKKIVTMQVKIVEKRLKEKNIALSFSPTALAFLAKKGYNPQYGARPLNRLIQSKVLTPLASMMVSEGMLEGGIVKVGVKKDELTFDVKRKKEFAKTRRGVRGRKKVVAVV